MIELNGKKLADLRAESLKQEAKKYREALGRPPGIAVILVGEDPASQIYVGHKAKKAELVGFSSQVVRLPNETTQETLKKEILRLNEAADVDGYLVQLPLPSQLNSEEALQWVDPRKDADALTIENIGLFAAGRPRVLSCTPAGVIELLKHYKIPIEGKKALVIGRSRIVGQPMAQLLVNENATVTIAHSRTQNLTEEVKRADIVVAAAGKPQFLKAGNFKKGACIVDVGIHRTPDGKLVGDVEPSGIEKVVSALTPVPGGVGPMTIMMLLENVLKLALQARK